MHAFHSPASVKLGGPYLDRQYTLFATWFTRLIHIRPQLNQIMSGAWLNIHFAAEVSDWRKSLDIFAALLPPRVKPEETSHDA